jgi:hypothetical protein
LTLEKRNRKLFVVEKSTSLQEINLKKFLAKSELVLLKTRSTNRGEPGNRSIKDLVIWRIVVAFESTGFPSAGKAVQFKKKKDK